MRELAYIHPHTLFCGLRWLTTRETMKICKFTHTLTATYCVLHESSVLLTATHCNTLQHTATHCNTLQHAHLEQRFTCDHQRCFIDCNTLQHAHCNMHTATHCNTHTATHCNTHTATHCNTHTSSSDSHAIIRGVLLSDLRA